MMVVAFIAFCAVLVAIETRLNRRAINVVSVLVLPYAIIVPLNNWIAVSFGFYAISDEVLGMLMVAMGLFFVGSLLADVKKNVRLERVRLTDEEQEVRFLRYRISGMRLVAVAILVVDFLRLALLFRSYGLSYISSNEFEGLLLSGPLGHVTLLLYGLIPILFFYWLKHKNKVSYLLVTLCGVGLLFFSMVKYHVIGMLVAIYLFVSFEDRRYLKSGAVLLAALVSMLFIGNYILTFFLRGTYNIVDPSYYTDRLWNYIAGSLILDNSIFTQGQYVGCYVLHKMCSCIFAFPNMFLNALFGVRLFPYEALPQYAVATNGQTGNVIDAIGYLWPSTEDSIDYIAFVVILFALGFLTTTFYNAALKGDKSIFHLPICIFLTFFVFFSFFGTFYVNSTPWEILIYSWLVPLLFDCVKSPLRRFNGSSPSTAGIHQPRCSSSATVSQITKRSEREEKKRRLVERPSQAVMEYGSRGDKPPQT